MELWNLHFSAWKCLCLGRGWGSWWNFRRVPGGTPGEKTHHCHQATGRMKWNWLICSRIPRRVQFSKACLEDSNPPMVPVVFSCPSTMVSRSVQYEWREALIGLIHYFPSITQSIVHYKFIQTHHFPFAGHQVLCRPPRGSRHTTNRVGTLSGRSLLGAWGSAGLPQKITGNDPKIRVIWPFTLWFHLVNRL